MKKLITSALCLALLSSCALAFGGCGGGGKMYVEGDFSEQATAEQVSAVLNDIEANTIFGDQSAADWSLGVHMLADLSLQLDASDASGARAVLDVQGSVDQKIGYSKAELGTDTRASGSVDFTANAEIEEGDVRYDFDAHVGGSSYLAEGSAYLDGSLSLSGAGMNVDVSGKYLLPAGDASVSWEDLFDLNTVWSLVSASLMAGNPVYIDESGAQTKVKVSIDLKEDALDQGGGSASGGIFTAVSEDSTLDIYSSIDKETNELVAFGIVIDATVPEGTEVDGAALALELDASVWYLVEDVAVDAPADPDSYFDLQGLIGALAPEQGGTVGMSLPRK